GGNGSESGLGIAVDSSGNAYITGRTASTDFPTAGAYQTDQPLDDVFVTKLNSSGNALIYSTYLGGAGFDLGQSIAVDASGNAYITGSTFSTDFPTLGEYQTNQGGQDVFVTKLNSSGNALAYSTYLGGIDFDGGISIAVDGSGNAYIAGFTLSTDFPTEGEYQTFQGIVDVFVTKLNSSGNALVYSTYLGGSIDDYGYGIAVDGSGNAFITGWTASANFPTEGAYQATNQGVFDAFVTKLNSSGNALVYSTYLGGSGPDAGTGITVDDSGYAYISGWTESVNFPTEGEYQTFQDVADVFITKFGPVTQSSCCDGNHGDLNGDGDDANILDLTFLVDFIFRGSGDPGSCPEESDVNGDGDSANILDLTYLVDFIFRGGAPPGPC
ncbi:MAG: SBBP repeat-containing protein, partial [candidate division Zixibacteria bacterium]|nr:SBBP repeat-containing protein [candidate division Zixibacteria bacterium]